jgi:hypothetical protein
MPPMETASSARRATALTALAVWAMAVPWLARALGLALDVPARLEVIDHVVPGLIVAACGVLLVRGASGGLLRLGLIALACLAGFWITVAHLTLVPEAIDGVSPWGAALVHLSAGPPITVLALWMLLTDDAG